MLQEIKGAEPPKGATATFEEFESALKLVDWDYASGDESAVQSYKNARDIEVILRRQYGGTTPHNGNKEKMREIVKLWNKYAPPSERFPV